MKYKKSGLVRDSVDAIIFLIMGVGMITLILIFVSVLGGSLYTQTASQITSISDTTIKNNITGAIEASFTALNTTGSYLPIIVLAVIIFIVLALVMSIMPAGMSSGGYGYGGSAL